MDDAKYVWWSIMDTQSSSLHQLYRHTLELAKAVDQALVDLSKEEHEGELDHILVIIKKRAEIINKIDQELNINKSSWSTNDKEIILELKDLESKIKPNLQSIQQRISDKIIRFQQGKHAAKGYGNEGINVDGAFFDKKK